MIQHVEGTFSGRGEPGVINEDDWADTGMKIDDSAVRIRKSIPTGWQCPVCKAGNAPSVTQCPCVDSEPKLSQAAIENPLYLEDLGKPFADRHERNIGSAPEGPDWDAGWKAGLHRGRLEGQQAARGRVTFKIDSAERPD